MMKKIFILLLFISQQLFAQVYQKNTLFSEDFSNGVAHSWSIQNNSAYSANVFNGKYVCYLKDRNDSGWRWTWVDIPDDLRDVFNQSAEVVFGMDFSFDTKKGYAEFALMFDLHNVTADCPGGSFYELYFTRVKNTVETAFRKNDNCRLGEEKYYKDGSAVMLQDANHLEVRKNGSKWVVMVNGEVTLELNFTGSIQFDKLKFNKGKYSFDNVTAFEQTVNLPEMAAVKDNNAAPKIWALCVGVEDYSKFPGYPKLEYSIDDAEAYDSFLTSLQGGKVPKEQIVLLPNEQATDSNILITANKLFGKAAVNDLIVVFLSGHGGSGFYCASNNILRYEEINKVLEKSKAKMKLLIADACHAGTWAKEKDVFTTDGGKLTDEAALKLFYDELRKAGGKVAYLLAARPEEFSWEWGGNGVFTHYLIKGLRGEAKTANSSIITISDIYKYVSEKVFEATKDKKDKYRRPAQQHPVLKGGDDGKMPVAICNE